MKRRVCMRLAALILLFVLLGLSGCAPSYRKGDVTPVLKIGQYTVTAEMYEYVRCKNKKTLFGAEPEEALEERQEQTLREAVEQELRAFYAVESLAKKQGVKLDDETLGRIRDEISESRDRFASEEEYYAAYSARYMTENVFYQQTLNYYLDGALFDAISEESAGVIFLSDEDLRRDVKEHFYAVMQIYRESASDETLMQSVREKALAGEDFLSLAQTYSEDKMKGVRYYAEGEAYDFFEKAALALREGEIGTVLRSEMGLHLIKRCEMDDSYVEAHLEEFRYTDLLRIYHGLLQSEAEAFSVEYL